MTDWRQPRSLEDFGKLTPAEQRVLDQLQIGVIIWIGDRVPDADAPETLHIRASFVRWLALGAEAHPLHARGLWIAGALVVGDGAEGAQTHGLDLAGCELARELALLFCRFTDPLQLRNARLQTLYLDGAHVPGLDADRLETRGDVLLRRAVVAGEVRLRGARVGGDLSCTGAKLRNADGMALNADRLKTRGNVVLRDAEVAGEVRLLGARVDGDFDCDGARLRNAEGRALDANGARITGTLFLREPAVIEGVCDLSAARLGTITDDPDCWPGEGKLVLDRCEYSAFTGGGVDAGTRIRWLAKQDPAQFGASFSPQPWEQCAKVLREMGHAADANLILRHQESSRRLFLRRRKKNPFLRALELALDSLYRWTIDYGREPMRAFVWLGGLWLGGLVLYFAAWQADAFKPNNAFVLRAPEWVLCSVEAPQGIFLPSLQEIGRGRAAEGQSQLDCFVEQPQPEARSFPNFNAGIYSFDVLFPLVEVAQQAHWVPDPETWFGWAAKVYHYIQIILGWALSLLAVAGFSGLVKTD